MSNLDIGRQAVQITDDFLADPDRHSLQGLKELVELRRNLLAKINPQVQKRELNAPKNRLMHELRARLAQQTQALEKLVIKLKNEIAGSIGRMKQVKMTFKRYKGLNRKPPRFIDKMR